MKKLSLNFSVFFIVLLSLTIHFQVFSWETGAKGMIPPPSPQIESLKKQIQAGNQSAVNEFWEKVKRNGSPLIDTISGDQQNMLVTFLWREKENTRNVVIFTQTGGLNPADNQMTKLSDSDVWYRSYVFPKGLRLLYTLSPNDDLTPLNAPNIDWQKRFAQVQPDPLNPKRFPLSEKVFNIQSVLELPGAPLQPWVSRKAGVSAGKVEKQLFKSTLLNNERNVWVYLPAKYQTKGRNYPLVILFDGQSYIERVPTPTILDNLIQANKIPPLVAVLIDNPSPEARERELPCNGLFADFLAQELMPWVRQKYQVTTNPAQTVITGSSYGGLAATCAGMRYPQIFGNVLSQSASYYWKPENDSEYEWVKRHFSTNPKLPLRFFLTVGLLETLPKPGNTNQIEVNRHFRDALKAKGYQFTYIEFVGAHEEVNWQGTLADGLITLLGKKNPKDK